MGGFGGKTGGALHEAGKGKTVGPEITGVWVKIGCEKMEGRINGAGDGFGTGLGSRTGLEVEGGKGAFDGGAVAGT